MMRSCQLLTAAHCSIDTLPRYHGTVLCYSAEPLKRLGLGLFNGLHLGSLMNGKTLRCAMGGTMPNAEGKGMGKALRMRAVEIGRERNFNCVLWVQNN